MEGLVTFLVGFPFLSAILLALFKNNNIRKIVTYVSSAAIIVAAITFAVSFFTSYNPAVGYLTLNETATIAGKPITELVKLIIDAGEVFLVALITVLSIKYKKYYAALLSIAQTGFIFFYEFSGLEPEIEINNFYIDRLTVIMVLIIAVVGTLITVYACGYFDDYCKHHTEIKDRRSFFFAIMYVFLGAMFALVMANNLTWLYFFWEVTSVCSFLLIGYTRTEEAINNCFKALWMNLLGGLGLALAIAILGIKNGITDLASLRAIDGMFVVLPVILLGFGALTKSAQFPFSGWLLGAMVAPTPSSALLHSATMVKAGVYLLIRLAPLMYGQLSGYLVALIGAITFLVASMLAINVTDGKRVLAYSTISNLGLITACAGIGTSETVWAAIFLLIFHAISKALLFQTVGSIEHQTGSRDTDSMHGLIKRYPRLALTLIIGMAGMFLAPFGMLISKWAALKSFIDTPSSILSLCLTLAVCFGSATTLMYWAKWLAGVLASSNTDTKQENTITMNQWVSLTIHSVLVVVVCMLLPIISSNLVVPYIFDVFNGNVSEAISQNNILVMVLMVLLVFVIPMVIYRVAVKKPAYEHNTRYFNGAAIENENGFVDALGNEKEQVLSNWYMDDYFSEKKVFKPTVWASSFLIIAFVLGALYIGGMF